ncbi:MAG TPA: hypothetical protein VMD59_19030 [Acidimicrobiales bacterium]|nr:hypothetical protein [Acidimicrobiales bacterium]
MRGFVVVLMALVIAVASGVAVVAAVDNTPGQPLFHLEAARYRSSMVMTETTRPDSMNLISCPSERDCVAVSQFPIRLYWSDDGGHSFSIARATTDVAWYDVDTLACASPLRCVAAGSGAQNSAFAFVTSDGGRFWAAARVPRGGEGFNALSCPTPATCFAVLDSMTDVEQVLHSDDGGSRWTVAGRVTMLPGPSGFGSLSCPAPSTCYLAGELPASSSSHTPSPALEVSLDGGRRWTPAETPPGTTSLDGIECTSPQVCLARLSSESGSVIERTGDGGHSWALRYRTRAGGRTALTCFSAQVCSALIDVHLLTTTDGGISWNEASLPAGAPWFFGALDVSCVTARRCFVVGAELFGPAVLATTADGGATWQLDSLGEGPQLQWFSCWSAEDCLATSRNIGEQLFSMAGRPPELRVIPEQLGGTYIIGCNPAGTCLVYGHSFTLRTGVRVGFVRTGDGGRSAAFLPFDTQTQAPPTASCPTASSCVIVAPGLVQGHLAATAYRAVVSQPSASWRDRSSARRSRRARPRCSRPRFRAPPLPTASSCYSPRPRTAQLPMGSASWSARVTAAQPGSSSRSLARSRMSRPRPAVRRRTARCS